LCEAASSAAVDAGVADVAGQQRARAPRHLAGDAERRPIDLLEILLPADDLQLRAVRVVREGLDDVGARVHEIPMQRLDEVGMLEHDLRHIRPGLEISASLELEQVTFRADDRTGLEPFEQPGGLPRALRFRRRLARHARTIYHRRLTRATATQASRAWVPRSPAQT